MPSMPPSFCLRPAAALVLSLYALAVQAAPIAVDLPEQPLAESIKQVAKASGLTVSVDGVLVAGRTAPALKGSLEPAAALQQLLANSGLSVRIEGDRATITRVGGETTLNEIAVKATRSQEGGVEDAYRVESVYSTGPLGTAPLLNIPNSIAILPEALLENVQATSLKEALKYIPLAQFQEQQGPEVLRPATRGMQGSNYQNTRLDGMTIFVTGANAIESLQQIEVYSGLPAATYGPANPAGTFNFVSKRPTSEPLAQLNLGYETASIATVHADLGGHLDAGGVVGYRLNLLDANGTAYVSNSELDRRLASLAVDVHPTRDTTVEITLSAYDLMQKGYPGWFLYGQSSTASKNILLPNAPDPTTVGYGQSYAGVDMKNETGSVRVLQDLGSGWHLVVGGLNQSVDRAIDTPVNTLTNNAGSYTSSLADSFAPHFGITSDIAYLNGAFKTGEISHDLTLGTTGFRAVSKSLVSVPTAASVLLGAASMSNPLVINEPAAGLPNFANQYTSSVAGQQGINVSDTIAFSKEWSVKMALSDDWMWTQNYSFAKSTGAVPSTNFSANGLSPMPSLIYKPRENVTTYLTWASSLQQGDVATSGSNSGQQMAPYRSKQWEAGIKVALSKLDLTLALFQLKRPFAPAAASATVPQTISGQQVNTGIEATAIGELTSNLTVYGGVTFLNPMLESTGNPSTDDTQYVGMPKVKSNVLLEYRVQSTEGVFVNFDWQYTSRRAEDDTNAYWSPSYSVFDLGARYATKLMGKATTWRLAIDNLANEHYWSTIGPSDIIGSNAGNNLAHLGAPRTVAASMSVDF